jgi:hypothetical protein
VQLVIGAHPHVLQPMEWRKEKNQLIVYSLGNFVSGQRKRYTDGGAMITIDLQKIIFDGDRSVTTIDSANYILQWVYRTVDSQKNYYVLPVPAFEADTTGFIKDAASRSAFKTYADDSRALYNKNNINITESKVLAPDTLVNYKVLFLQVKEGTDIQQIRKLPYGVETQSDGQGNLLFYSGNFKLLADADRYRNKMVVRFGYREAKIVEFINDKKKENNAN